MKLILSLFASVFMAFAVDAATGINITNVQAAAGVGLSDRVLGLTNVTHTSLISISDILKLGGGSSNTNQWYGPTNSLFLGTNYLFYAATSDVKITGFLAASGYVLNSSPVPTSSLLLSNAAATNITLRIPVSVRTSDGARSYIVTNAQAAYFSVENRNGMTNGVFRMFW